MRTTIRRIASTITSRSIAYRRAFAAIAAVLALGAGSAAWAASSASAAPAAASSAKLIPVCTAQDLSVWVNISLMQGAAGTWYYPLEFTNDSNHTCRTWGWPGVSALNATGHQLGDAAQRSSLYAPHWVNIPAGGTAHALFSYAAALVNTSGCKPVQSSMLRVYAPNQRNTDIGFFALPSCTVGGRHVYLRVSAIRPGLNI